MPGVILGAEDTAMDTIALTPTGKAQDKQGGKYINTKIDRGWSLIP